MDDRSRDDIPVNAVNDTGDTHDIYDAYTGRMVYAGGRSTEDEPVLLKEHELRIIINDRPVMQLVCTKDMLKELVTGRLYTEGIIDKPDDIGKMYFCRYENEVNILTDKAIEWEDTVKSDSTCCTGNVTYLRALNGRTPGRLAEAEWKEEWIFDLAGCFTEGLKLHNATGATHSCLLSWKGRIMISCEDIGRHNAIDKAVGYALCQSIPLSECILYTSGRVPKDMVIKVIMAGVPVLASKSAATYDACKLAGEYGLTLICRAWNDKMLIMN